MPAADHAQRNELVTQAIPLARMIARTFCRDRRIVGRDDEIEADALAELLVLADTFRPGRSPWLAYVAYNLKFRLVDVARGTYGRPSGKHYERRSKINRAAYLEDQVHEPAATDSAFAELETADAFARVLDRMTARNRWIVGQRLAGVRMDAIGAELGISESRVSQILTRFRTDLERAFGGLE